MSSSWKTTFFGLAAAIGAGITGAYLLKPELLSGFPSWLPGLGVLLSSIGTACLGLAARDNNKTSEQVGAGGNAGSGAARGNSAPLLLFLAGGLVIGAGLGTVGCQAPAQRITYDAVALPDTALEHSMQAWGDYVKQFAPSLEEEAKVRDLYNKAKAADLLAIDAARILANLEASGSTNTFDATSLQQSTANTAAGALADLVNFLRQLGVKL